MEYFSGPTHLTAVTTQLEIRRGDVAPSPELFPHLMAKQCVIKVLRPATFEHGAHPNKLVRYSYAPGELILARRDTEEWVRWISAMSMLIVELSDDDLRALAGQAGMSTIAIEGTPRLEDERIAHLIAAIEAEHSMGFPSSRLYRDAISQALAAALTHGILRRPLRTYRAGLAPAQLRRVIEYIQEHLDRDLNVAQLADTVELSSAHFSQMFRRSTGYAPHQYVLRVRIERAKQMLRTAEARVIDVALSCGFETPQHFARVFKRLCHATPSRYRRDWGWE